MDISPAAASLLPISRTEITQPQGADPVASPQAAAEKVSALRASAVTTAEPSDTELVEAVQRLQNLVAPVASDLNFSIEKDLNKTVVKVIDRSNDEVIRQFPSDEALRISREITRLQGLLIREAG